MYNYLNEVKQGALNELRHDLNELRDKFFLPESEKQKRRVRLEREIEILEAEAEYLRDKRSELY